MSMSMNDRRARSGFSLLEVLIASTVSLLVVASALALFIRGLQTVRDESLKNELKLDLERSLDFIRQDLRLSSVGVGLMAFYPLTSTAYSAISFPQALPGTNGLLTRDANGRIIWDRTVIYYVARGDPDQFIRVQYAPRSTNATPTLIYSQLCAVVAVTNVNTVAGQTALTQAALPGEAYSLKVVFSNLVNWSLTPPTMVYDGYAPAVGKADTVNWGGIVLTPGMHTLTFTVQGKNASSSGYKVGIDKFSLSASASPREGEMYFPQNKHPAAPYYQFTNVGGTVSSDDMSTYGADWSGNSQLTFTPDAVSNTIAFDVYNDLWCDTEFNAPVGIYSNCARKVDRKTNSIPDTVISMDMGGAWYAADDTDGYVPSFGYTSQYAIVNFIRGGTNAGQNILGDGCWARFFFEGADAGNLYINNGQVGQLASGGTSIVAGTTMPLTFGGSTQMWINQGTSAWSDWVPHYEIKRTNSYIVRFDRANDYTGTLTRYAHAWTMSNNTVLSYIGPTPTNALVAIGEIEVRYPSNGLYQSGIFDTHNPSPAYNQVNWTHIEKTNAGVLEGDVDLRVRSGSEFDLSDAGAWEPLTFFQGNTANSIAAIAGGRYLQYEMLLTARGSHTNTGVFRDVTIDWPGSVGICDLTVDFAQGPDYGIVNATVDGQAFVKGVNVNMEIYQVTGNATQTVTGVMEVRPLNTGR